MTGSRRWFLQGIGLAIRCHLGSVFEWPPISQPNRKTFGSDKLVARA
jgi:hypothetical protein